MSGASNVLIGSGAGSKTHGSRNTFVGPSAGASVEGNSNTILGGHRGSTSNGAVILSDGDGRVCAQWNNAGVMTRLSSKGGKKGVSEKSAGAGCRPKGLDEWGGGPR